jgi:hypothetical protein
MAGQEQRGSRGHERRSRRGSPSELAAAASADAPGSVLTVSTSSSTSEASPTRTLPPAATPRATFRLLQQKGLTPDEAASLTAFMCGLPTTDLRWSLRQINQMLFLQRLYQWGRLGIGDDERTPPH